MRKRILLNLQEASNPRQGIGQYELNIANGLASLGCFDLRGVVHRTARPCVPFPVQMSRLPRRYFFNPNFFNRWWPFSYNAAVGDFSSDVSVFFANSMPMMRIRGKCIGVIHDLIPFRLPEEELLATGWWSKSGLDFYKYQHRYLAECADIIVTVSEFSKREIAKEFGVDDKRIRIVNNGVDIERFTKIDKNFDAAVKTKYKLPDRYFLYFGTLASYKNVANLIRGYANMPPSARRDVPLLITQESKPLGELAKSLGVGDDVRFLGFVDEVDKPSIYRQAMVSCFLSRIEGFGIPLVEAMGAGTPVLGSTCASIPEVVGDAGLLVGPDDINDISDKLEQLLTDEDLRAALVEKGRERACRFTWRNAARQLANVIDEVVS